MSERGEEYQNWEPKANFPETFPSKALILEMDKEQAFSDNPVPGGKYDKALKKYNEFWAAATDADIEEYAVVKSEATAGDYTDLKAMAERKRDEAKKALRMEIVPAKSIFEKTMGELADDKKVFEDLDRTMGTGDPQ
ncbi:MAG: hypothetical protein A2751_03325 [Candidatus Doudnabacteria bacterium RIFCSPHIGHO2_01_FULL_46_14]|uniref:Uncharacterized protein n=1 Tax=Candidatus Doudnabacteria bacterium RIFCSPHIGHO2_01_FULL_46_14 TaxID=1817824 RepID=A0A1F5NKJ4_9BACT|nr:MAG: hypothetical protein A2751_03325 [Candidatus Doudnabacteria bacterium RIFCSPHIGHO2_01_FULL_46_14]